MLCVIARASNHLMDCSTSNPLLKEEFVSPQAIPSYGVPYKPSINPHVDPTQHIYVVEEISNPLDNLASSNLANDPLKMELSYKARFHELDRIQPGA